MTEFGELAAAYEGLEGSFADRRELEAYRASMLERSGPQADFLRERLPGPARVLEIGTGNGRLLVELARRGALAKGLGIDLAESRIAFAKEWARDLGLEQLTFEARDVFAPRFQSGVYSLALCITGAFGYFEPVAAGSALRLGRLVHDTLQRGGRLVLELYPHPRERALIDAAGGELRVWSELGPDDPWRYYLSHYRLDGNVLSHKKTFIHRTTGEIDAGRQERLQLYTRAAIELLLEEAGFHAIEVFEGWTGKPYAGGDELIVTALK